MDELTITDPDEAEREFLAWWSRVNGTPVDDRAAVMQGLQDAADGGAMTVPVPGVSNEPLPESHGGPKTYTAHELHMAKLDEAERYGITRKDLRDFLDLLRGDTPEEIAEFAAKLYARTKWDNGQPQYSAANPSPEYMAESDPAVAFIRRLTGNY